MYRRKYMKQTIQTQLDCKATASLQESIEKDLQEKDKSLASLLESSDNKDNDDETISSD